MEVRGDVPGPGIFTIRVTTQGVFKTLFEQKSINEIPEKKKATLQNVWNDAVINLSDFKDELRRQGLLDGDNRLLVMAKELRGLYEFLLKNKVFTQYVSRTKFFDLLKEEFTLDVGWPRGLNGDIDLDAVKQWATSRFQHLLTS
jgi:hypothetical protein